MTSCLREGGVGALAQGEGGAPFQTFAGSDPVAPCGRICGQVRKDF